MAETCKTCRKEFESGIWLSPQFRDEKVLLFCSDKCKQEYLENKLRRIKVNYPDYYEKIKIAAENKSFLGNKDIYAPFIEAIKNKNSKKTAPIKIGVDTSIIVNLILKDINLFEFKKKEFSGDAVPYYAMRTKYEFKRVMLNKFDVDKKEKNKLWRRIKSSLGLKPLKIGSSDISKYTDKVKKANTKLIEQKEPQFQKDYKIENEDIEIIASFLKSKIKIVYTSDRAFHETCEILRLDSKLITMQDYSMMKKRIL
jgi:ribosomal protein L24E